MSTELVKAGWARNQAEAEMIQGMLLEEGIPSVLRRSRGFDVPDFLAAGPRDVMVDASAAERARALLAGPEGPEHIDPRADEGRGRRLLFGLAVAIALAVAVTYLLYVLIV
jgi:hypothetical protein